MSSFVVINDVERADRLPGRTAFELLRFRGYLALMNGRAVYLPTRKTHPAIESEDLLTSRREPGVPLEAALPLLHDEASARSIRPEGDTLVLFSNEACAVERRWFPLACDVVMDDGIRHRFFCGPVVAARIKRSLRPAVSVT